MTDAVRVLLVDPAEESRRALLPLLDSMEGVWLAEVCVSYALAVDRALELRPEIVLVATDADPSAALEVIRRLAESGPDVTVLPASQVREGAWILELIRAGAREFLPLPTSGADLREAVLRLAKRPEEPAGRPAPESDSSRSAEGGPPSVAGAKVIAVTGAGGEVGCTSVAVNLATTLAKLSKQEVALADFDLLFGSVDAHLDLIPEKSIRDVIEGGERLDSTLLKRMLAKHASGVFVLPRPLQLQEAARIEHEGLRRALALLQAAFPRVVIDTSKSLQASDFIAFETADVILVVVQLEPTCLRNTAKLLECFRHVGDLANRVRLVANRVGSLRSVVDLEAAAKTLQLPFSWQIPNATKVFRQAEDRGVPIEALSPRCEAQRAFTAIARALGPFTEAEGAKSTKGFFRDRTRRG